MSTDPLHVLLLDGAQTWRGGEQQVMYLHQGLLERGIDSTVACPPGSAFAERLRENSLPFWPLPQHGGFDPLAAWRLGGRARCDKTIVHTHTSHAHSLALLASRLRGRFPLVVSRRVDFPVAGGEASRHKYLSQRVDRYLAISSQVEEMLRAGGVPAGRIRRIPSGIDLQRFENLQADEAWRASLGLPPGRALVGSVAALADHKDQPTLLKAFARMMRMGVDAQLVILGEGGERAKLEALRAQLGLEDRVLLPGFTRGILEKMLCFDFFVLSSKMEGLGTAILDAMALGLAVVATRAGGIPDAVVHEETGLLLPVGDVEGLAQAMTSFLRERERSQRFGTAGRRRVQEHFDVRQTVEDTLAVYREIAGEGEPERR